MLIIRQTETGVKKKKESVVKYWLTRNKEKFAFQKKIKREVTAIRNLRTATKSSPRLQQLEKARMQQRRPNAAKNK